MSRRILLPVLLSVVSLAIALAWSAPLRAGPADPLALVLSAGKSTLVVGEPLQIRLRLENHATANMTGDFYLGYDLDRVRILVSKNGAEFAPYVSKAMGNASVKKVGAEPVTILAGGALESDAFVSFDVAHGDLVFSTPGTYRLQAMLFSDFYRTQHTSNVVTLTVTAPSGGDGAALQFIRTNRIEHLLTAEARLFPADEEKVNKLRELIAAFPSSLYTPHAQSGLEALCAAGLTSAGCPPGMACLGDCGFDGAVSVDELVRGVSIALGTLSLSECPVFDGSSDGSVTVDELIKAVGAALGGCR